MWTKCYTWHSTQVMAGSVFKLCTFNMFIFVVWYLYKLFIYYPNITPFNCPFMHHPASIKTPSAHQSIYSSTCLFIHPCSRSIHHHLFIHPDLSIHPSIHPPVYSSTHAPSIYHHLSTLTICFWICIDMMKYRVDIKDLEVINKLMGAFSRANDSLVSATTL